MNGIPRQITRSAAACVLAGALAAHASLVEEKRWLPVKVLDSHDHEVSRQIMVTIFYDNDTPAPHPVVVLNHGRATTAQARAALGRAQYSVASKWLAQLGFIVAVPTRIGYGKTSRIPSLWIYTENDMYFGPKLPKAWFDAFVAEGGKGEYTLFPPDGENGHSLFTHSPEKWQPRVLEFLRANGYPNLPTK